MDNVTFNSRSYALPTKTLAVVQQIDELMTVEVGYEKGQIKALDCLTAEYQFIIDTLGADKSAEILGSDDINEIDVSDVSIAVMKILTAYTEKVEKAKLEKQLQSLNDPKMKQAMELIKAAGKKCLI